jgi:hypothetical protein
VNHYRASTAIGMTKQARNRRAFGKKYRVLASQIEWYKPGVHHNLI